MTKRITIPKEQFGSFDPDAVVTTVHGLPVPPGHDVVSKDSDAALPIPEFGNERLSPLLLMTFAQALNSMYNDWSDMFKQSFWETMPTEVKNMATHNEKIPWVLIARDLLKSASVLPFVSKQFSNAMARVNYPCAGWTDMTTDELYEYVLRGNVPEDLTSRIFGGQLVLTKPSASAVGLTPQW
jgi:hypothetical protein